MASNGHIAATAQLTHIRLLVDDFPGCYRFYRDIVGLPPGPGGADGRYAEFNTGGSVLALWQRASADGAAARLAPGGGSTMLALRVWDVDASYRHMTARGAHFEEPPSDRPEWGLRIARLRDPAGNLVEINARLRTVSPKTSEPTL